MILAGCRSSSVGPDASQTGKLSLLPLTVGNQWLYGGWYATPSLSDSFHMVIDRQTSFGDETTKVYRKLFYSVHSSTPPSYGWLYSNKSDGVHLIGGLADTDTLLLESMYRKYPTTVGDSWQVLNVGFAFATNSFEPADTVTVSTIAVDKEVITPAGAFTCVVYKYSFKPDEDVLGWWNVYEYYSPGIGLVLQIVKNQAPGQAEIPDTVQLTSLCQYHIN